MEYKNNCPIAEVTPSAKRLIITGGYLKANS